MLLLPVSRVSGIKQGQLRCVDILLHIHEPPWRRGGWKEGVNTHGYISAVTLIYVFVKSLTSWPQVLASQRDGRLLSRSWNRVHNWRESSAALVSSFTHRLQQRRSVIQKESASVKCNSGDNHFLPSLINGVLFNGLWFDKRTFLIHIINLTSGDW